MSENSPWPELPLAAWSDTCDTLQLWTQIIGKVRIALTPLVNHWWNATLFVTARGLAAPAMPYAGGTFDIIFDFASHRLVIETSDCRGESFALEPMAVADFYDRFMARLRGLGIDVHIWTMPGEIENAIPFERDRTHAQYDPVYAQKFWQSLLQANRVMNEFRARFIGKASPVHFLLGQFRPCRDALFRPHRAAPERRDPECGKLGDGRGLFARSFELRLLARQRRLRPCRVLRLRLSGTGRLWRYPSAHRRRVLR
jgi:hypothetical protein